MFFKRIELFGFKSFVNRVTIKFQPGITAVIGPNGCGKTNIVDAVKWVLGAQSAKQLRGSRMEDIIFNGTSDRKALGLAEVSLTFDNSQQMLPIDFQEVTVTRRLFRSGESEYFINKAACRLKDITEMFMDTGLGVDAYSLMEQNKIDFILNSKPEERRAIFEEAAGIMKYKTKKEESLRKLEQTKSNLLRISDIVGEIKKQIGSLDYQVRKTKQYQKNKENIKSLDVKHLCEDYMLLEKEMSVSKKILDDIADRMGSINTQISKKDAEVSALRLNLQEKEESIITTQEKIFSLSSEVNRAEDRVQMGIERAKELEEQVEDLKEDIKDARGKIENLEKSFGSLEEAEKELTVSLEGKEASTRGREEVLEDKTEKLGALKTGIRNKTEEFIGLKGSVSQVKAQMENLQSEERNARSRRERLCREEEIINEDRKQVSVDLENKTRQMDNYIRRNDELSGKRNFLVEVVEQNASNERLKRKFHKVHDAMLGMASLVSEYDELLESALEHIKREVSEVKAQDDKFEARIQPIVHERNELEKKIVDGAKQFEEFVKNQESIEKQAEECRASISQMEAGSISLEEQIKVVREEITELKVACTVTGEKKSGIRADYNRAREDKENSISLIGNKEKTIVDIGERIKEIEKAGVKAAESIAVFHEGQNTAGKVLKEIQEEKENIVIKLKKEEGLIGTLRKDLSSVQSGSEQDRIKETQTKMKVEQIKEKLSGDYDISLDDALASFTKEELESRQSREEEAGTIEKLRKQIDSMGPVNLAAPEEYAKLDERYKFLKAQEEDLIRASEDLRKVISKINTTSRANFEKTFNQVRENFKKIFNELFEGGSADIVLVDNENMLESGIDIIAQPPGKKLQHIALLSGGEKALCAIALLFAVFLVKPSPFCILDEIDAPLDDANLERFKNMLKKFTARSQFIMITHNKKTMEMADILYGITMEEFGVSNIVSVKLKKSEPAIDQGKPEEEELPVKV